MKKILSVFVLFLLFTGCSTNKDNIVTKFKNRTEKIESYRINGELEITNNETTYKYNIEVGYEKNEKYKVSLKNKINNHEQIVLKNNSNVYVLTPSLNKSFKFESEWPYNNSQSYLYQSILNDIENDDKISVEKKNNEYIITTKVNYQNNKNLVNQKIYLDQNANIKKVEVNDKNGLTKIKMTYNKFDDNPKFEKDYFEISGNIKMDLENKEMVKETEVSYPLYIPNDTKLVSENIIEGKDGNRTILTFAGSKPFTLIEEASKKNDNEIISVDGEPEFINGVFGNVTEESVSWSENGIDYYAVSDTMDTYELLEVVNSMNTIAVGK